MPELPEVEVTRLALAPHLEGQTLTGAVVRQGSLRWPVPAELGTLLRGRVVLRLRRRGKYLMVDFATGQLLLHLGMSGSLRLLPQDLAPAIHDHVDILLADGRCLRFRDPRRFGLILWNAEGATHPLLRDLGPEPLAPDFSGETLYRRSRGRQQAVKSFLMDAHTVVGVGNIYANESLFRAGIDPRRAAGRISAARYEVLVTAIGEVLREAIAQGGTTLRDFLQPDGGNGYFRLSLQAYGREGEPCTRCGRTLRGLRLGGRATVFCPNCQR
ncbi:bifunctional DNA-formamidopyrimidine glycosylase/DNA-(apurinic or apyrimidinic site) lyase [Acidithiobacillus sp.]|uniref:bifunctional DNA-formamidopyrimidine glycosylase/DNA-(apurinic or apyrimidinic site) lyase n=1 Tax=Acidithiobacillus sp. TaxID=1872118 RepID=UPI0025BF3B8D|nr:bifunctional DNA-formamidopyrimidine glycosylase/DNA-(apurinic or apyrimidinic site) lyase [Acidithiobacillus sp.]